MPVRATTLDRGDFVYSPRFPANRDFAEYLDTIDRLLAEQREAEAALIASPFSPEWRSRKADVDRQLREFVGPFVEVFNRLGVEKIPTFLPVLEFLTEYRPIVEPFSVLHCCLDLPLHTVRRFSSAEDLDALNSALAQRNPIQWWRNSPMGHRCYLFGTEVWELRHSERDASPEGVALLFAEIKERRESPALVVGDSPLQRFRAANETAVTNDVRQAVWRRDRGRCAECRGHEDLDFVCRVSPARGGSTGPENVRLLCGRCRGQSADP
jgi:hypothetical protein